MEANETAVFSFRPQQKKRIPKIYIGIFFLKVLAAVFFFFLTQSPKLADALNQGGAAWIRKFLAKLFGWVPFSLAEGLLLLLPIFLVLFLFRLVQNRKVKGANRVLCCRVLAIVCVILILFVGTLAPGYFGSTLDQKIGLERTEVSVEELYQTTMCLQAEIEELLPSISFPIENDSSVMPYSIEEMNEKLNAAYDTAAQIYPFFSQFHSSVKPIMLSRPMTYTHISGIYSFFTGEANINTNYPDYILPFSAAHELAHQRGIAREEEANFVAFLVCLCSEDPYIRYSGLMNVYEYCTYALASSDVKLYLTAYFAAPNLIYQEESAYSAFFQPYRESKAAKISDSVNDSYLKSLGNGEGTRSYNLVVDLAVAYYRTN